uniref:Uncharacterized protein n=1 Tax=Pipistrellus kuhlii TaxID=59472 RepID=A0A7J8B206_PIPKU|nr:hypothetical protein mPipKuh1_007704 [Pipistrellus kuhlii]
MSFSPWMMPFLVSIHAAGRLPLGSWKLCYCSGAGDAAELLPEKRGKAAAFPSVDTTPAAEALLPLGNRTRWIRNLPEQDASCPTLNTLMACSTTEARLEVGSSILGGNQCPNVALTHLTREKGGSLEAPQSVYPHSSGSVWAPCPRSRSAGPCLLCDWKKRF